MKFSVSHLACVAALATAALLPAQAIVLTQLPGVVASASNCYLNAGCVAANDWSAAKILDGLDYDRTGRYAWNDGNFGTAGAPAWVRLDFGSVFALESAELRFTYNQGRFANQTNVYQFRTSTDGANWAVSASGTLVDSADPALLNNTATWAPGTGPLARYVEYRVVGGSHWAALSEMKVEGVSAVPEPGAMALWAAGLAVVLRIARHRRA